MGVFSLTGCFRGLFNEIGKGFLGFLITLLNLSFPWIQSINQYFPSFLITLQHGLGSLIWRGLCNDGKPRCVVLLLVLFDTCFLQWAPRPWSYSFICHLICSRLLWFDEVFWMILWRPFALDRFVQLLLFPIDNLNFYDIQLVSMVIWLSQGFLILSYSSSCYSQLQSNETWQGC